uniref:Uncharacterized protein n=1 Tax=Chlorocebus sabaeus TaxID=60711 RepID=A0A0D9RF56_CHLSB
WTKAPEDPGPAPPRIWQGRIPPAMPYTVAREDPASLCSGLQHPRTPTPAPWTMAPEDPAPRPGLRHSRTPPHCVLLYRRTLAGQYTGLSY